MNKIVFKKALPLGILIGLVIALVVILARTLIGGTGFVETLISWYGILTIICFPIAAVYFVYNSFVKKENK